jgi:hypothetical protein
VFQSVAATATFWLALAKVGSYCYTCSIALVQVSQSGLNDCSFISELARSLCGLMLNVVTTRHVVIFPSGLLVA